MKCINCNNEIKVEDKYCAHCGHINEYYFDPNELKTEKQVQKESPKVESNLTSVFALIFSIFGGYLGLILAVISLSKDKEKNNRIRAAIAIVIFVFWFAVSIIGLIYKK